MIVIAGSPNEPVCRSLSLDLERRGFIVYMLVGSIEDEHTVQNESRADIRPLNIDITEVGLMFCFVLGLVDGRIAFRHRICRGPIQQLSLDPSARIPRSESP